MENAIVHMEYLISQLLEAAQLRSGTVRLRLSEVPVGELLDQCAALLRPQAEAKGLELRLDALAEPELAVRADHGRVLQVLSNLAGNACKFTPKGGTVTLSARRDGTGVHFCVADTGPGIAPEHQARIFERFFRVADGAPQDEKGLGLGLSIAQSLVALHKGRIWVESEPGRGARFRFSIPR